MTRLFETTADLSYLNDLFIFALYYVFRFENQFILHNCYSFNEFPMVFIIEKQVLFVGSYILFFFCLHSSLLVSNFCIMPQVAELGAEDFPVNHIDILIFVFTSITIINIIITIRIRVIF